MLHFLGHHLLSVVQYLTCERDLKVEKMQWFSYFASGPGKYNNYGKQNTKRLKE